MDIFFALWLDFFRLWLELLLLVRLRGVLETVLSSLCTSCLWSSDDLILIIERGSLLLTDVLDDESLHEAVRAFNSFDLKILCEMYKS